MTAQGGPLSPATVGNSPPLGCCCDRLTIRNRQAAPYCRRARRPAGRCATGGRRHERHPSSTSRRRFPVFGGIASYLRREPDHADDLVQECLSRAIAKIDTWQPGTNLRAWLFVILRNCHINEIRREQRIDSIDDITPTDEPR